MILEFFVRCLGLERDIDGINYIVMAEGRYAEVLRPFSNRVLGPLLAHYVGFAPLQVAAGILLAVCAAYLLRRAGVSVLKALPFLFAPWLTGFAFNLYMPDLLACGLTALMFVCMARAGTRAALPVLALMVMARESSVVIAGVWFVALVAECWRTRAWTAQRLWTMGGILLAVAVGMALVRVISADSPGDINGLGLLYMPVKALANGFVSVTGIQPWHDVYARELPQFYTHPPLWKMACPAVLRLGRFAEVGIYEWHPFKILDTIRILLFEFGVLVPYAIFRRRALWGACRAPWQKLAFCAGLVYWLLTPICGFSPARYIGYAWPLFWFAPLVLLQREPAYRRRGLLVAHFVLLLAGAVCP